MNTQDLEQISIPSEQALSRRVVEHVRKHGKLPSLAQLRTMTADRPSCDSSAVDGPGRVTNRTSALARHLAHRRPGH